MPSPFILLLELLPSDMVPLVPLGPVLLGNAREASLFMLVPVRLPPCMPLFVDGFTVSLEFMPGVPLFCVPVFGLTRLRSFWFAMLPGETAGSVAPPVVVDGLLDGVPVSLPVRPWGLAGPGPGDPVDWANATLPAMAAHAATAAAKYLDWLFML